MFRQPIETAPQLYTRVAGALYLGIIVCGVFAEGFIIEKLIVSGDPAASAHNILAASTLWNVGVAANLLVVLLAVPLLWIEYLLLRPVSRHLVVLAIMLNLVSLAVESVSKLFLMLVLPTLSSSGYNSAIGVQSVEVLANLALKSHGIAFNIALIFFGLTCIVNGYLIFRSGYLPRFIGVLMQFAGVCYLVGCLAQLFAPALGNVLAPAILIPPFIGESSFCLWLLFKGVNLAKWNARSGGQPTPA